VRTFQIPDPRPAAHRPSLAHTPDRSGLILHLYGIDGARIDRLHASGIALASVERQQMSRVDGQVPWRSGDLVEVRGARCWIHETETWSDCISLRLAAIDEPSTTRTLLVPFDRPRRVERRRGLRTVKPRRWLHAVRRALLDFHPFGGFRSLAQSSIHLLPHQLEPALAMLRHGVTRVLIADGVGLGKTIQAGLIARELAARSDAFRAIVLVPAGLRDQWAQELVAHFDIDAVQADAAWLRSLTTELPAGINPWSMPGVYIASLDFAKRPEVLRPIEEVTWDLTVIDEAHLASTGTDRRAAANAIASRSRRIVLLTATPHDGEAAEFDALTRIGGIGESGSPIVLFRRSRLDVSSTPRRRTILLRVALSPSEWRMHHLLERYTTAVWNEALQRGDARARLVSIVLRKRALSSAASLAASIRRRLDLLDASPPEPAFQLRLPLADEDPIQEDEEPSQMLAVPGMQDGRRERRWLASIAQAAANAAHSESKIARLLRFLRRIQETFILFTEYRDTLRRLERAITATGQPILVLHGGMPSHERRQVQDRFNRGGVSLLATDAASEGLNLHHHCRLVIHFELPWSAARIEQRAGRVDRLGQSRRVHEIALVASGTAERLVLAPLARRAAEACATTHHSAGLLDLLTEPRITEAIFGEAALAAWTQPAQSQRGCFRLLDLRTDAAAEASRVESLRRTARRSPVRTETALFTAIRRRRLELPAGLAMVVSITLRDVSGRAVHIEPKVIHVGDWRRLTQAHPSTDSAPAGLPSDRAALLALLRDREPRSTALSEICRQLAAEVRERVEAPYSSCLSALREREREMLAVLPSASVQLVQAGLFDRRALREQLRRRESMSLLSTDISARLDAWSSATLTAGVEMIAAILIGKSQP
jgi:superfamily II DNA or RNA helicase